MLSWSKVTFIFPWQDFTTANKLSLDLILRYYNSMNSNTGTSADCWLSTHLISNWSNTFLCKVIFPLSTLMRFVCLSNFLSSLSIRFICFSSFSSSLHTSSSLANVSSKDWVWWWTEQMNGLISCGNHAIMWKLFLNFEINLKYMISKVPYFHRNTAFYTPLLHRPNTIISFHIFVIF